MCLHIFHSTLIQVYLSRSPEENIKMKIQIAVSFLCMGLAFASIKDNDEQGVVGQWSKNMCQEVVQKSLNFFQTEAEITNVKKLLQEKVCPQYELPRLIDYCFKVLLDWGYPEMVQAVIGNDNAVHLPERLCSALEEWKETPKRKQQSHSCVLFAPFLFRSFFSPNDRAQNHTFSSGH
jgi:hypothetical protein